MNTIITKDNYCIYPINCELLRAMKLLNDRREIMNIRERRQYQSDLLICVLAHVTILGFSIMIAYKSQCVMTSVPNTMIHIVDRLSFGIGRITSYIGLGHPVEFIFDFLREEFQETTYAFYAIIDIICFLLFLILYMTLLFAKRWVTEPLRINLPFVGFLLGNRVLTNEQSHVNVDQLTSNLVQNLSQKTIQDKPSTPLVLD